MPLESCIDILSRGLGGDLAHVSRDAPVADRYQEHSWHRYDHAYSTRRCLIGSDRSRGACRGCVRSRTARAAELAHIRMCDRRSRWAGSCLPRIKVVVMMKQGSSENALQRLLRAIVSRDRATVSRLLAGSPELARRAITVGATRSAADAYFFEQEPDDFPFHCHKVLRETC